MVPIEGYRAVLFDEMMFPKCLTLVVEADPMATFEIGKKVVPIGSNGCIAARSVAVLAGCFSSTKPDPSGFPIPTISCYGILPLVSIGQDDPVLGNHWGGGALSR